MLTVGREAQHLLDEAWTRTTGLPLLLLMEQAATAVCQYCLTLVPPAQRSTSQVLVLAGKGQNGGDAWACARLLQAEGFRVDCREVFPGVPLPAEAAANRLAWLNLGNPLADAADLPASRPPAACCLVIDGIFGTGFRVGRPLPAIVTRLTERLNRWRAQGCRVIAIDIPSGVDADSGAVAAGAVQADATVTFVRPKTGLAAAPGRFSAGLVHTASIGLADTFVESIIGRLPLPEIIDAAMVLAWRLPRRPDSHKGRFGRALLLGGSPGLTGAICLAGQAAARAGTGLVYIGVSASVAGLVLATLPEALVTALPESETTAIVNPAAVPAAAADSIHPTAAITARLRPLMAGQQAVAVGPGAGLAPWLGSALQLAIETAPALVLDADALNAVARDLSVWQPLLQARGGRDGRQPAILTPHPGEFARLAPDLDLVDRQAAARELARRLNSVVILKGASTVICDPTGRTLINLTGHEGLAKGGSGDVLCGLVTGLLAQGMPALTAAAAGVYLHGLAADLAARSTGRRAMLPGDVLQAFGSAFRAAGWEEESMHD